ncbi:MAG TPA: ferritin [Saprospiraceae bacterium]|nr:ferritin [Saprospiraceae bacterium]HQW56953.1 ferritin [Saprospiraceae bacterium]
MINTNRLSTKVEKALNAQLNKEAHAAQIFLSYGAWCATNNYAGTGNFLFRHSAEERNHMQKIVDYILQRGGTPDIQAIPAPPPSPIGIHDCFEKVFQHEVENTESIYRVFELCQEEKDWASANFMDWFVKEQIEEEALALALLDKLELAGGKSAGKFELFTLDQSLEKDSGEVKSAQQSTTTDPA